MKLNIEFKNYNKKICYWRKHNILRGIATVCALPVVLFVLTGRFVKGLIEIYTDAFKRDKIYGI